MPEGHPSLSSRRPVEEGFTRARPAAARLHEPAPRASPPLGPEPPAAAATAGIQHGDEPSPPPSLGPVDVSTERRPGLAPQGSLVTPPALDRPVASAFPVGFRVVARGGAAGGTPPAPLPAAELALALTFGPFGIAANGGVSATLDTALPPGRVSTTAGWASLGGTGVLALSPKVDLDAALGGRLFIVQASTHGFTANRSVTLGSFALFAEAGLSVRVWGPVLLGLWLNAAWRPLEERLSVTGIEGSVNLPRWHLGGYAGAGLRWR